MDGTTRLPARRPTPEESAEARAWLGRQLAWELTLDGLRARAGTPAPRRGAIVPRRARRAAIVAAAALAG